ncbi:MAG TPA: response regulator [Chloroflexota bacterium]|nr:response regulator [Chloroflexota bacterium]
MSYRVLIVDDDPNVCTTLGAVLRTEGYEVTAISELAEARQAVLDQPFDLVLAEQSLNETGDGLELLVEARRASGAAGVILTSHGSAQSAELAREMGILDYLQKPCSVSDLKQVVRDVLEHGQIPKHWRMVEDAGSEIQSDVREP